MSPYFPDDHIQNYAALGETPKLPGWPRCSRNPQSPAGAGKPKREPDQHERAQNRPRRRQNHPPQHSFMGRDQPSACAIRNSIHRAPRFGKSPDCQDYQERNGRKKNPRKWNPAGLRGLALDAAHDTSREPRRRFYLLFAAKNLIQIIRFHRYTSLTSAEEAALLSNFVRSISLPRCSHDFAVPSETPRIAAVSFRSSSRK